jgi:uncharacterized membrane protein (DUF106 family)
MFGLLPYQELFLMSAGLAALMVLLSKFLTNQAELRNVRHSTSALKEKLSRARKSGDAKEMARVNADMLRMSQKQFRENMKPMFASLFIFVIALGWLGSTFGGIEVALPFALPLLVATFPPVAFTATLNWFWWYLITILPVSMTLRKMLDVV